MIVVMNARDANFVIDHEDEVAIKDDLYKGTNVHIIEDRYEVKCELEHKLIFIT